MIDLDNTIMPSETFDKTEKKRGFFDKIGGMFGKKEEEEEEINEDDLIYNYSNSYAVDDNNGSTENLSSNTGLTEGSTSEPDSPPVKRKTLSHLLSPDDEDDDEIPLAPASPKGNSLLNLLSNIDDDEEPEDVVFTEVFDLEENEDEVFDEEDSVAEEFDEEDSVAEEFDEEEVLEDGITEIFSTSQSNTIYPQHISSEKPPEEVKSTKQVRSIDTYIPSSPKIEKIPSNLETISPTYNVIQESVKTVSDPLESRKDILAAAGYIEIIETLATKVMLNHEVPNISLESFGAAASVYTPGTLEIATFGKHQFVGNPLTQKQKTALLLQVEKLVEKAQDEGRKRVVLSATQQVQHEGVVYRTLLLSDDLLDDYMNMTGRTVLSNGDTAKLTETAVIIQL